MENNEKNTKKSSAKGTEKGAEKSWMHALNLKPEDFSACPEDQNPLLWAFESQLLKEDAYTHWASEAYELPLLKTEFFDLGWDKTLKDAFQDVFPWERDCFPVYKWKDVLYVACLEPQQIPIDSKVCFLIASPKAMLNAWASLDNIQPTFQADEASKLEGPPVIPMDLEDDQVTPNTTEIVAEHPDLEPSVLNFDLSSLDLSSAGQPPEVPSAPIDPFPRDSDGNTEELTQIADPNIPDDLTQEHTLISSEILAPEPPNMESLDGLDFGTLDLGGPPPPQMEEHVEEVPKASAKTDLPQPPQPETPEESLSPTPPSFADLDLSALAPPENTPDAVAPEAKPLQPQAVAQKLSKAPEPPATSGPPHPPQMLEVEDAPAPQSAAVENIKAPVAPPKIGLAPEAPISAPPPPTFDDDKTPPPQIRPSAEIRSSAPSDKSITPDHLQGGPELEKCESIPQIVEHIFLKIHKDFKKLMWIPKSRSKGFIPDLVMGAWAPKEDTWTTSINIRSANIFRVAWSSKLPFHGPVSLNSTNKKYFEMWDQGKVPEHVTVFPLCSESKKCLGFVVGFGKGQDFDNKKTLKRFEQIMDLTAKQLSSQSLDKVA